MELTIRLPEGQERIGVTGPAERNLKIIREALGVTIAARHGRLRLSGESRPVGKAALLLEQLADAAGRGKPMARSDLLERVTSVSQDQADAAAAGADENGPAPAASHSPSVGGNGRKSGGGEAASSEVLDVYLPGKRIKPMTGGQRAYLRAMHDHDLTFCAGPAGTGKTYLAVAAAAAMLKRERVRKLVLVRPAVEAGEKIGFLPGSMQEKVNPYLRPLFDALHDMMEFEQIQRLMAVDVIEIVPLAFMRGRTLNDACVILDEAQNTTRSQMLMFLTRLGHGSKMIVTGDTSQIDLDDPRESGLVDAARRLRRTRGVAMVTLGGNDIVRHSLVQRIVDAYGQPQTRPQVNEFEQAASK